MGVAQAQHPSVVRVLATVADLQEPEVAVAAVGQRMRLVDDGEMAGGQRALDLLDEPEMRNRLPRRRGHRGANGFERVAFDGVSAAVKDQITGFHEEEGKAVTRSPQLGTALRAMGWMRALDARSARKAGLHLQAFRMTMMEIATAVRPSARHHHRSR